MKKSHPPNFPLSKNVRISPPEDWVPPSKTILVAGTPRSGSTLLCSLMSQTGTLGKPNEFFKRKAYPKWKEYGRPDDVQSRCRIAVAEGVTPNGVCSMKVFGYHLVRIQEEISIAEWFPGFSYVWLHRRDLLGQAISFTIATQTRRFREYAVDRGINPEYNAKQIYDRLEWFALEEARWREYFARTALPVHQLYYEDLVKTPHDHMIALSEAVGVPIDISTINPASSEVTVQRTALNKEWRERFLSDCGDITRLKGSWNTKFDAKHKKANPIRKLLRKMRLL